MGFTFGFAYYFYEISQAKLRQRELAEEKAKTLAREAQLASLESRIHPHFLFNTLNSIAALIREDPILAEKMVEKLSALLRYSLDSNANSLVSLEQELEITEKYLEIEKVRFDERLQYKIELDEKFSNVKLPPLALQTLVENSIKHVASKTSGKTEITVSAKVNGVGLMIEVSDNGMGFDQNSIREGHGLDILQKRLTALFQNQANLEIIENGTVRLKIPK
jgi:LytS/YehU family sensor histidine kinase